MSIEIKTAAIEPLRVTFDHIAERLGTGKAPSRYQEVVFDLQPTLNFHYRPTWAPEFELYDTARTAIELDDWNVLLDPRQYYYASYVFQRSRQQEGQESDFAFAERRDLLRSLDAALRDEIERVVLPLRHFEWGANQVNAAIAGYGYGTPVTSAATFQMLDRLGNAQYISRIGLLLSGNEAAILDRAKETWLEDPVWQPLRRLVERLLVTGDWFEAHVAQNFVLDGLVHPLVFEHFDRALSARGGGSFGLLTRFCVDWFAEARRWVDATLKVAAGASEGNRAVLSEWIETWQREGRGACLPLAEAALGSEGGAALDALANELAARGERAGLA